MESSPAVTNLALWLCVAVGTLLACLASLLFALSLADLYALTLGGVKPGDPMLGARFAPPVWFALLYLVGCALALWGAITLRRWALRRISTADTGAAASNKDAAA